MTTEREDDERAPQVIEALADLAAHTGVGTDPALAARLDALAAQGRRPAPQPTGELAAMLAAPGATATDTAVDGGPAPTPMLGTAARRRAALAAGGLVIALAAGTGAAAADVLPGPVQRVVARFSEHFLPFDLPRPAPSSRPVVPVGPSTTPTPSLPAVTPTQRPTGRPAPGAPGASHRPSPSAHPSSPARPPASPGAPTVLPGHRSSAAPTTAPTPGQRGRSQSLPARPARGGHQVEPAPPRASAPHPARPSSSAALGGTERSQRGARPLRPSPSASGE